MRLLREPLVHFVFIGAMIYVLFGLFADPDLQEDDNKIVVSAGQIEVFKVSWQKRWNRAPTDKELDGIIQQYIRETVLYRQAISMGLDKNDRVIRRRLAQKMEFLVEDLATMLDPDEQTLKTWFNSNQALFQKSPRYTFTQIFIDPDKRGDATLDDAKTIKASLQTQTDPLANISELGDGLMLQDYYPNKSPIEIQKQFGSGFTQSLEKLSSGQWHGPILSGYGVHLVYVQAIIPASIPPFTAVREQVKVQWLDEQRESLNKKFYDKLINTYDIVIEETTKEIQIQDDKEPKNLVKDNSVARLQESTQ
jgi:peptidyl-prolyl cis-trans isomerase C